LEERVKNPKNPKIRLAKGRKASPFAPIDEAVAAFRAGQMLIVVDDEQRENEGDLTMAASKVTPEAINFMVKHGRGLVCLSMTPERLDALDIPLEASDNSSGRETAFCISIDARAGTTTGISAADRAHTVHVATTEGTVPRDLARPGHVFPLRARAGGVLVRAGHTEAAVDLARIAGLKPAGVICEILNEDGTMARVPELTKFARKHKLLMITIADLIRYRMRTESLVRQAARALLPTEHGPFEVHAYESQLNGETHVALVRGDMSDGERILVRVHS
jgi:3,4-dihydroxy 2-butanone 4-phosphate synthase/GTP cyclohydrolase II